MSDLQIFSGKFTGLRGLPYEQQDDKIIDAIEAIGTVLDDLFHSLHNGEIDSYVQYCLARNYFGYGFEWSHCAKLIEDNEQHHYDAINTFAKGETRKNYVTVLFSSTYMTSEYGPTLACINFWGTRPTGINCGTIVISLPTLRNEVKTDLFNLEHILCHGLKVDKLLSSMTVCLLHELIHIYFDRDDAVITERDLPFPYADGIKHWWENDTPQFIKIYRSYKAQVLAKSPTCSFLARQNPDNVAFFIFLLWLAKRYPHFDFSGLRLEDRRMQVNYVESDVSMDSGYYSESNEEPSHDSETDTESDPQSGYGSCSESYSPDNDVNEVDVDYYTADEDGLNTEYYSQDDDGYNTDYYSADEYDFTTNDIISSGFSDEYSDDCID